MTASAVLVTGGSGYLGGFLVCHFAASGCHVGLTYHSNPPPSLPRNAQAFQVDLATGAGLDACLAGLTAGGRQLFAVINCAAISQPAACKMNPAGAEAVNVPTKLLDALERWWQRREGELAAAAAEAEEQQQQAQQQEQQQSQQADFAQQSKQDNRPGILRLLSRISSGGRGLSRISGGRRGPSPVHGGASGPDSGSACCSADSTQTGAEGGGRDRPPLFVQLSTDQVYDGSRPRWTEGDEPRPVNAYGRSKLAAERAVAARWPNHAILRSSLLYGPEPPLGPVDRPLFLQFIIEQLGKGEPVDFYEDEWRSPVRVRDVVRVVQTLIARQAGLRHRLFNMGGPERLSRADMARAVAKAHGLDAALVRAVPAPPAAQRGVASPADISMDSSLLETELQLRLTPLRKALQQMLAKGDGE
ncbi:hypothetical protein ABPG77_009859 [Micractinium sp. CCAP 211/92]